MSNYQFFLFYKHNYPGYYYYRQLKLQMLFLPEAPKYSPTTENYQSHSLDYSKE